MQTLLPYSSINRQCYKIKFYHSQTWQKVLMITTKRILCEPLPRFPTKEEQVQWRLGMPADKSGDKTRGEDYLTNAYNLQNSPPPCIDTLYVIITSHNHIFWPFWSFGFSQSPPGSRARNENNINNFNVTLKSEYRVVVLGSVSTG